ncbi:uncharacterized protein LOC117641524 isoform X2 [Thrips palmi]|uniref:Uncharacterized protein LOC117641524 isoform X2 n=1 Tax=Thrips palmi TaxID=161013 RepID=A0A6P8YD80_THRPL|nr:uncharacterized protein LOC117641524 isoform X2 [Thrips palmi]
MNSRNVNPWTPPHRRVVNQSAGAAGAAAVTSPPSRPTATSRRLYTVPSSGGSLGGSSSATDARAAQERAHEARVAIYEEKQAEIRKKKLEEKMAKYHYLIGNTLGKSDGLTMQQVRELQDQQNSEIAQTAALLKLRETQDESRKDPPEVQKESVVKSMQQIRMEQQAKYNNTVQKKSPT